jgi:hypothetical protein
VAVAAQVLGTESAQVWAKEKQQLVKDKQRLLKDKVSPSRFFELSRVVELLAIMSHNSSLTLDVREN